MKKFSKCIAGLMLAVTTFVIGCGLQEDDGSHSDAPKPPPAATADAGTDANNADAGSMPTTTDPDSATVMSSQPAPVDSPMACVLTVARQYISSAPIAELRGTLPGMTWSHGTASSQLEGTSRIKFVFSSVAVGTYDFSYLDPAVPNANDGWAQYGDPAVIAKMSADARKYLDCSWPAGQRGECHLRVTVSEGCKIAPAGNM